jgi:hypothetical protein
MASQAKKGTNVLDLEIVKLLREHEEAFYMVVDNMPKKYRHLIEDAKKALSIARHNAILSLRLDNSFVETKLLYGNICQAATSDIECLFNYLDDFQCLSGQQKDQFDVRLNDIQHNLERYLSYLKSKLSQKQQTN